MADSHAEWSLSDGVPIPSGYKHGRQPTLEASQYPRPAMGARIPSLSDRGQTLVRGRIRRRAHGASGGRLPGWPPRRRRGLAAGREDSSPGVRLAGCSGLPWRDRRGYLADGIHGRANGPDALVPVEAPSSGRGCSFAPCLLARPVDRVSELVGCGSRCLGHGRRVQAAPGRHFGRSASRCGSRGSRPGEASSRAGLREQRPEDARSLRLAGCPTPDACGAARPAASPLEWLQRAVRIGNSLPPEEVIGGHFDDQGSRYRLTDLVETVHSGVINLVLTWVRGLAGSPPADTGLGSAGESPDGAFWGNEVVSLVLDLSLIKG